MGSDCRAVGSLQPVPLLCVNWHLRCTEAGGTHYGAAGSVHDEGWASGRCLLLKATFFPLWEITNEGSKDSSLKVFDNTGREFAYPSVYQWKVAMMVK